MNDGVTIGLDEIYREFRQAVGELRENAGVLRHLVERFETAEQTRDRQHHDHESRIRTLEGFRARLLGGAAVLGFFTGGLGAALVNLLLK